MKSLVHEMAHSNATNNLWSFVSVVAFDDRTRPDEMQHPLLHLDTAKASNYLPWKFWRRGDTLENHPVRSNQTALKLGASVLHNAMSAITHDVEA
jgi:hypothetical protein